MSTKQFYIKIDDQPIEVTEEVYRAYKRPVWAERKRREVRAEHEVSLDLMADTLVDSAPSLEETVVNRMMLQDALATLTSDERALINALFFEGLAECEYAAQIGTSQQNIHKKKKRILSKLKNVLTA